MSAPIIHGGGVTEAAAAFGGEPKDWLDLSTGINPNPVSLPDIPVNAWHRLPDRHLVDAARNAAARYYRSCDIMPLPVPGTQSVIQLLPRLVAPAAALPFSRRPMANMSAFFLPPVLLSMRYPGRIN